MPAAAELSFLLPLLAGFILNSLSAFTSYYCTRWGVTRGRRITFVLRNVVGIPLWAYGYYLAARTPMADYLPPSALRAAVGWALLACGSAIILFALAALRVKAAAPSPRDSLVESGLYRLVRHPVYSGMVLEFAGLALLVPSPPVVLATTLGLGWLVLQSRLEETDLCRRIPAYRQYMQRVPSFLPRRSRPSRPDGSPT